MTFSNAHYHAQFNQTIQLNSIWYKLKKPE